MNFLRKLKNLICNSILNIVNYYVGRFVQLHTYCKDLLGAVLVNWAIMPPAVYLTYEIMDRLHVKWNVWFEGDNSFGIVGLGQFALAYFLVGMLEETYFRYLVYDCLLKKFLKLPNVLAIILSSVVFGAAHLANPGGIPNTIPQAVGAGLSGLWFAHCYNKRGLHFAILVHGLYDLSIWVLLRQG